MVKLIDINTSFGGRESIQRFDPSTLIEQIERTPASLAFVRHRQGPIDQITGNRLAESLCGQHDSLRIIASIDPRDTFGWREEIQRQRAAGTRLFFIDPVAGAWSSDSILMDDIVGQLSDTGSALLVDATTSGLPTRLAALADGRNLPLIFTEARYFPLAELIPLAKRFSNVYIETSRLTSPNGIELCVDAIGSRRLVYGSGTCRYPAWVAWQDLESARISVEQREDIAWKNSSRLLGLDVRDTVGRVTPEPDPRLAIDVHLHDQFAGAPFPPFSPTEYSQELRNNSIAGGVSSSVTAIMHDLQRGNDENRALVGAVPELFGYVVVDPRYPEESSTELRRLTTDPLFVGAKIHCSYAQTMTREPSMDRLFGQLAECGKPVLIHPLGSDWPEALGRLANRYRHLPIIAAHAGYGDGPHPTHDAAARVAAHDNIYIEFCSTHLATGAIRRGIDAVGIDRVLFGSDFPLISLPYMARAYMDAALSAAEAHAIYWQNPVRLFSRFEDLNEQPGSN